MISELARLRVAEIGVFRFPKKERGMKEKTTYYFQQPRSLLYLSVSTSD